MKRSNWKTKPPRKSAFEEGTKPDGSPFKIGVIDLPSFYSPMESSTGTDDSTTTDVDRILQDFKAEGVDAVVLDLRMNGGGSLREAVNLTGLFIDRGPVVQVKNPDAARCSIERRPKWHELGQTVGGSDEQVQRPVPARFWRVPQRIMDEGSSWVIRPRTARERSSP